MYSKLKYIRREMQPGTIGVGWEATAAAGILNSDF